ncbi:hypothetical protein KSF_092900 [Reticulibacter mediterranei]|uniref:Uncharacterized protein n=1 Tax=Reticulibacter mediterranei TaxID=2778369 RepID=A0A8J3N9E5_9CHLR|nr:hypothetical protein [Reticulibacter mediterranei]GHO99242.1 hypothetical protein KSF_092900 [Reticulibacter mediterranei]
MKLYNDTVFDNSNTPENRSPMSQQGLAVALIALPCLIIIFGLVIDRLIDSFATNGTLSYMTVVVLIPAVLIFLSRSLFKRNASPLRMASRWTLKSYEESIVGLDERERQVIDQAYRMSYRIVALICWLAIAAVFANISFWHLTYYPGLVGVVCIMMGVIDLLSYLPTAIVVWKEQG